MHIPAQREHRFRFNVNTKISVGAIQKLLTKAAALELRWPLPDDLNDAQLARLFYPDADTGTASRSLVPPVIKKYGAPSRSRDGLELSPPTEKSDLAVAYKILNGLRVA